LAIIKRHALLNCMCRERVAVSITVTVEDVEAGFRLYYAVPEANELGLSPELYHVYEKLKSSILENGVSLAEFQTAYYREFRKTIGYDSAGKTLKTFHANFGARVSGAVMH
jgi:hypothetical protein